MTMLARLTRRISNELSIRKMIRIYETYKEFTMVPPGEFITNLQLCSRFAPDGCIVECGVWRGGMSAGISEVLPGRRHFLFDSFEGLPPAKEIDGAAAIRYQTETSAPRYRDNCRAEESFAEIAMRQSSAKSFQLVKGWFCDTLPTFTSPGPIAVLRLDGDWYESTMDCLNYLYPLLARDGLVIIDDYLAWDGCSRAVHDYFSIHKLSERIREENNVIYFIKRSRTETAVGTTDSVGITGAPHG